MDNNEDVKIYFKCEQWDKLSDLDKTNYKDAYNTYEECLIQGIKLLEPDFATSNNDCKSVVKVEDALLIDCKEENQLPADLCTYCDNCEEEFNFSDGCGTSLHILDNDVPKGTQNRAKRTLPKDVLEIFVSNYVEGVFALKTIPKGIKFGPYKGLEAIQSTTGYVWKIICDKLVDVLEVESSNWMKYVNCARNIREQNLIAFQYEGGLYYKTVKTITKGKELLVFYGEEFTVASDTDRKQYFEPDFEKELENVYACGACCLGFSTEKCLKKHMAKCPHNIIEESPLEGIAQCPFCSTYLIDKSYLNKHMKHCRDKFKREPNHSDDNSVVNEALNMDKKFKCSKCIYQTDHKGDYKRHLLKHDGIKPFQCKICNKRFTRERTLKSHLIMHTGEKPYQCNDCDYTCKLKSSLSDHVKDKHDMVKRFSCNLCPYKSFRKTHLTQHLRTHTKERPYRCDVCNKSFTKEYNLKRHMNIHFDVKFKCSKCSYASSQKDYLKRHMNVHLDIKFQCLKCDYAPHRKADLMNHYRRIHS